MSFLIAVAAFSMRYLSLQCTTQNSTTSDVFFCFKPTDKQQVLIFDQQYVDARGRTTVFC